MKKQNILKVFSPFLAAALISASFIAANPVEAKPRNCPNVDYYAQPNSFGKERIGSLSDPEDLDIVSTTVEPNGQKWYQFRFFNGRPGQTGAGWIYGWLMASQICFI